jgi:hypothetical protein
MTAQWKTKRVVLPKLVEQWGFIPHMVTPHSDKPLWEQIHDNYGHGGGWRTQSGWTFENRDGVWYGEYSGDPVMRMIDMMQVGDETLALFPYGYVMWTDGDNIKMARID